MSNSLPSKSSLLTPPDEPLREFSPPWRTNECCSPFEPTLDSLESSTQVASTVFDAQQRHESIDFDDGEDAPILVRRRKALDPARKRHPCPACAKVFDRPCDLTKHEKTHLRPFKCFERTCKFHHHGFPTEKERERHENDRHSQRPHLWPCSFPDCSYTSKRESNVKQHMEKKHDWEYQRSKSKGKTPASSANHSLDFISTESHFPSYTALNLWDNSADSLTIGGSDMTLNDTQAPPLSDVTFGVADLGNPESDFHLFESYAQRPPRQLQEQPKASPQSSESVQVNQRTPPSPSPEDQTTSFKPSLRQLKEQDNKVLGQSKQSQQRATASSFAISIDGDAPVFNDPPHVVPSRKSPREVSDDPQLDASLFNNSLTRQLVQLQAQSGESSRNPTHVQENEPTAIEPVPQQLKKISKRPLGQEDERDDERDDESRPPSKRPRQVSVSREKRRLMKCIFRVFAPDLYNFGNRRYKTCHTTPHEFISTLVRHLERYHDIILCRRCLSQFGVIAEKEAHCSQKTCKAAEGSQEDKWHKLYQSICGGTDAPSPYFQAGSRDVSNSPKDSDDVATSDSQIKASPPFDILSPSPDAKAVAPHSSQSNAAHLTANSTTASQEDYQKLCDENRALILENKSLRDENTALMRENNSLLRRVLQWETIGPISDAIGSIDFKHSTMAMPVPLPATSTERSVPPSHEESANKTLPTMPSPASSTEHSIPQLPGKDVSAGDLFNFEDQEGGGLDGVFDVEN